MQQRYKNYRPIASIERSSSLAINFQKEDREGATLRAIQFAMASKYPPGRINNKGQIGTAKYKCEKCGEKWKMKNSKGDPKICEECGETGILPHNFMPNPPRPAIQSPRRMFGDFNCDCGRHWPSAYAWTEWDGKKMKWVEFWQECRGCGQEVYPSNLRPLQHTGGSALQKPHESSACEMCKKYGDCRNLQSRPLEVEEIDWDDNASIRSESSSISGVSDDHNLSDGTPVNSDEETTDERLLSNQLKKLSTK